MLDNAYLYWNDTIGQIYELTDLFNSDLVPRYLVVAIYNINISIMKIKQIVQKMKSSNVLLFQFMLTVVGICMSLN